MTPSDNKCAQTLNTNWAHGVKCVSLANGFTTTNEQHA